MGKVLFTFVVIFGVLPFILDSKATNKQARWNRSKRQAAIGVLNPPIPTSVAQYIGSSRPIDACPRDEVEMPDGKCYRLLSQGPCTITQYIILDPVTYKPFCAERLCAPDRIFIFSDQKCHDPRSLTLCPPGRQLYTTAFGTPICQCPTGTYEGDDDLDDDVCEPLLGQTMANSCPPGQVFWFRDFSLPPECVPDPCGGENLNRGPNDLPFVPFSDGRCFQLGTMPNVCPAETWYTIALSKVQGVCSSLEDAGYDVYAPDTLRQLIDIYGPPITRDTTAPIPVSGPTPGTSGSGGSSSQFGVPDTTTISRPTGGQSISSSPGIQTGGVSFRPQEIGGGSGIGTQGSFGQGSGSIALTSSQATATGQGPLGGDSFSAGSQGIFPGSSGVGGQGSSSFSQTPFGGQSSFSSSSGVLGSTSGNQGSVGGQPNFGPSASGIGSQGSLGSPNLIGGQASPSSSTSGIGHGGQGSVPGSQRQPSLSSSSGTFGVGGQGISNIGIDTTGQGSVGGTPNFINQGSFNSGFGNGDQGAFGQGPSSVNQGNFNQGSPGFSPRPTNPFQVQGAGMPHIQRMPGYSTPHRQPSPWMIDNQSVEQFGSHDDDSFIFGSDRHDSIGSAVGDISNLMIRQGHILADIDLKSPGGKVDDIELLQAPPGHELHGFFNSVRSLVNNGPHVQGAHRRYRRSPLPHASPGNVFETRLVGCRAGAAMDVNAKCRDLALPPQSPASRPARAAAPVDPVPGCPAGQGYAAQRTCQPLSNISSMINSFGLG